MVLRTTEVIPLSDYQLNLRCNSGDAGEVDLSRELEGEVFAPLRDPAQCATAYHHPVMRTVAWANGADLAPEYLLESMRRQQQEAA